MLLMMLAAVAAYFVKGMCGFANTLVFTSILSFGMNNVDITPTELLVAQPANYLMAWRERKHINWRIALPCAAMVVLGGIPGTFLLKSAGTQLVKLVLGGLIIFTGLHMLYREKHPARKPLSPLASAALNLFCGVSCGLYGIGALMAANIARSCSGSREARGTMSIVFITEALFRTILYIATGILTPPVLYRAVQILPFALGGMWLGMRCVSRINERAARMVVIGALVLSGAALIASNL